MCDLPKFPPFVTFPKIPRLFRDITITEKIDGTNGGILIEGGRIYAASRNRWITPDSDNHGFAKWVEAHKDELISGLGDGLHHGEWWGPGIGKRYSKYMTEKKFSLFNTSKWTAETTPLCCSVVPILYSGVFKEDAIHNAIMELKGGSVACPRAEPEGIVVYHERSGQLFKWTFGGDGEKGDNHIGE